MKDFLVFCFLCIIKIAQSNANHHQTGLNAKHRHLCVSFLERKCKRISWGHSNNAKTRTINHISSTAFASQSIPPPPPISVPVYSLAAPLQQRHDDHDSSTHVRTSMNIITFATPVSVAPPKLWTVSLYTNTMTKQAFFESNIGILQLLSKDQTDIVPILGKRSGHERDFSKKEECSKVGYSWIESNFMFLSSVEDDSNSIKAEIDIVSTMIEEQKDEQLLFEQIELLPGCQSYIKLKLLRTMDAGDHEVALCQVLGVGEWNELEQSVARVEQGTLTQAKDENDALYTGLLRQKGII